MLLTNSCPESARCCRGLPSRLQSVVLKQATPSLDARGRNARDVEALPERGRDRIIDGDAELPLERRGKAGTAHVGADDRDRVAVLPPHRPDQIGDLLLGHLREGEIVLQADMPLAAAVKPRGLP